ncbi:hypothetical protein PR202_ga11067 [Eleusine coracana subsp. coracana]|uniref:Uncharacterized protein n=1 Tax=Eleusine coracana subsp. coracana TaxID=191504 RepID=A0AAV5C8I8_ELECO|nr:hypothetical protein PR202_ga11067 [Eleusine coracana subsp. coracana]
MQTEFGPALLAWPIWTPLAVRRGKPTGDRLGKQVGSHRLRCSVVKPSNRKPRAEIDPLRHAKQAPPRRSIRFAPRLALTGIRSSSSPPPPPPPPPAQVPSGVLIVWDGYYLVWHPPGNLSALMGFLQSTFSLLVGTGCGIYIAQNYNVPNIKKVMRALLGQAKELEESYKKPTNGKNKD